MNERRLFGTIFSVVLFLTLAGCNRQETSQETVQEKPNIELSESWVQAVGQLATLECYYHNTAKVYSEKQVLFWNTSKKLWVEYSGKVKLGVDTSRIKMDVDGNVVTVTMPEATVLSCVVDETSLSEDCFYSETQGLGGDKVGAEDQTQAFQTAQENMRAMVEEDKALLLQARARAQTLIENYVKNIGDVIDVDYEIRWIIVTEDVMSDDV